MFERKRTRFIYQTLGASILGLVACQSDVIQINSPTAPSPAVKSSAAIESPRAEAATTNPESPSTAYQEGINLASSAFLLGQQATSPDDWDLVASRWEQAIEKLQTVPSEHEHYSTAQTKLPDYTRNLAHAQQQLKQLQRPPAEIALAPPTAPPNLKAAPTILSRPTASNRIPIIDRRGGIPIVEVTFNNGQRYPMILDTGASHTHLTRDMANTLGIQVTGQVSVATASSNRTLVDVGRVDSIRVGNITRTNLPISIGDALPIGLLGNDVYQNYDVILQANTVEFRAR